MGILDSIGKQGKKKQKQSDKIASKILKAESLVGSKIFGPLPKDGRREFFCLDEHTWVWHEEWYDEFTDKRVQTTRYDVRKNGIFKSVNNGPVVGLDDTELETFQSAVKEYVKRVKSTVYKDRK